MPDLSAQAGQTRSRAPSAKNGTKRLFCRPQALAFREADSTKHATPFCSVLSRIVGAEECPAEGLAGDSRMICRCRSAAFIIFPTVRGIGRMDISWIAGKTPGRGSFPLFNTMATPQMALNTKKRLNRAVFRKFFCLLDKQKNPCYNGSVQATITRIFSRGGTIIATSGYIISWKIRFCKT